MLPALDRRVTLGQYMRAVRAAKANPDAEFKHGLTTWWPTLGRDIVQQFRDGMHERISQAIPYSERGSTGGRRGSGHYVHPGTKAQAVPAAGR